MTVTGAPATREELAQALKSASAAGEPVRFTGGGTKVGWGAAGPEHALELPTAGLDRILEHNAGDLTAVLEAGVPLARAQEAFAEEGQMLALDPPDGGATLGGVVATADSGPLRGRYGGVRDLVVGMRVALSDGTLAKSGGKVIKNVAGYDLAKLFAGSLGTLGAIVEVSVRLHPLQPASATAIGRARPASTSSDARSSPSRALPSSTAASMCAGRTAAARCWSASPARRRGRRRSSPSGSCARPGLETEIEEEDEELWAEQRARQRGGRARRRPCSAPLSLPTRLPDLIRATEDARGSLVGRAVLGLSWLRLPQPPPSRSSRCAASFIPRPASFSTGRRRSRWIRGDPSTRPCSRSCAG